MTLHHIIVGHDGSPAAHRATEWAAARAGESGAEVTVVTVEDPDTQLALDILPRRGNWREDVATLLRTTWTQSLRDAGVTFHVKILEGRVAPTLMKVATELPADLIVIGSHGRGNVGDRLLGSVTYRLVHRAPCPVTVIPPV